MAKAANTFNVSEMKLDELLALKAQLETELTAKRDQAITEFIDQVKTRAEAIGMSIEELVAHLGPPKQTRGRKPGSTNKGSSVAPKFRSPDGATWSGRGRTPVWLRDLEAAGKKREEFAV